MLPWHHHDIITQLLHLWWDPPAPPHLKAALLNWDLWLWSRLSELALWHQRTGVAPITAAAGWALMQAGWINSEPTIWRSQSRKRFSILCCPGFCVSCSLSFLFLTQDCSSAAAHSQMLFCSCNEWLPVSFLSAWSSLSIVLCPQRVLSSLRAAHWMFPLWALCETNFESLTPPFSVWTSAARPHA